MSSMSNKDRNDLQKQKKVVKVEIRQEGEALLIPENMSLAEAEKAIQRRRVYEEETVGISAPIECFLPDGAYALHRVLEKKFGFTSNVSTPGGWFEPDQPPVMIGVQISLTENLQVPWGRIVMPGIEGYLETSYAKKGGKYIFSIGGEVKRKHEKQINQIIEDTRKLVLEESIYKNKAIRIRFRDDDGDVIRMPEPKFIDLSGVRAEQLIYSEPTMKAIETSIFTPIEHTEEVRAQGVPLKRGVLLAGPYGCLAGDTMISVNRCGKGFEVRIEDLVQRFNQEGRYAWDGEFDSMTQREMSDGTIRLGRIEKAWQSGMKNTFTVVTNTGRAIRATAEHPFHTTRGWLQLSELVVGDEVHVRGNQKGGGRQRDRGERVKYRSRCVGPHHPYGKGNRTSGYHVSEHRLMMEAAENGLNPDEYLARLKSGRIEGFVFLDPEVWVVHHEDENPMNNDLKNLKKLTQVEHARLHGEETVVNVLFKVATEFIVSIEPYGEEMTYDIEVTGEPHNFVANGFVVHNTGKTLAASVTAKKAVENNWTYIECERAEELAEVMRFAQLYGPCVLFCEDLDAVMSGQRNINVNDVLNTIDGVESKSKELLVVLTTNNIEKITPAMLRPGRIDDAIYVGPPDALATEKLLRMYGGKRIAAEENLEEVGRLLAGNTAAVVREVVDRSTLAAIKYNKRDKEGNLLVTQDALIDAVSQMQMQLGLLAEKPIDERSEREKAASIMAEGFKEGTALLLGAAAGQAAENMKNFSSNGHKPSKVALPAGK